MSLGAGRPLLSQPCVPETRAGGLPGGSHSCEIAAGPPRRALTPPQGPLLGATCPQQPPSFQGPHWPPHLYGSLRPPPEGHMAWSGRSSDRSRVLTLLPGAWLHALRSQTPHGRSAASPHPSRHAEAQPLSLVSSEFGVVAAETKTLSPVIPGGPSPAWTQRGR